MKQLLMYGQSYFYLLIYFFNALTLPAHACSCGGKVSSIKANMHTLQTAVETYAVDWKGRYPASIHELLSEAKAKAYWKELHNPYSARKGLSLSFDDLISRTKGKQKNYHISKTIHFYVLGIPVEFEGGPFFIPFAAMPLSQAKKPGPGMVIYEYLPNNRYGIYGLDKTGEFIQDKGQNFVLSNS